MALFRKKHQATSPVQIGAIVGSGSTYRVASYSDSTSLSMLRQEWQSKAYDVYDSEGHLYYATNYVGGALARCSLTIAKRPKADGQLAEPIVITSGPLYDAVQQICDPKAGQSGLLRQLGRNIFLAGESWLVAEEVANGDGSYEQKWAAVSIDELRPGTGANSSGFARVRLPGAQPEILPKGSLTIRIWKEHPRFSELADAGTRSCMELLEKIITLNRAEKAIARSRLAGSGILALPQELVPPGWQNQSENANPMQSNPLWEALAESMTAPLKDEGHPSAVVPLVLVGPAEVIGKIKYEGLERHFDTDAAQASIGNAIQQIANTLELPKEILLGTGEATHWTAWAIREDVFEAHIKPFIELICEALTWAYLKKAIQKLSPQQLAQVLKDAGVESADELMVWYDASSLLSRPDKSDAAMAAHDRIAITDEGLRKELGLPEEYAVPEEEKARRIGIKLADAQMAITGKPTPPPQPMGPGGGKGGGGPLP